MNSNIVSGYCDGWACSGHTYTGEQPMRTVRRLDIQLCPQCYADYCEDCPPRALVLEPPERGRAARPERR